MKYCINCGKKIDNNVKFCPNCGTKQVSNVIKSNHKRYIDYQHPLIINAVIKKRIIPIKCSFIQAFTSFWKNYNNFSGYSSRSEFWWWFLIEYIISTLISLYVSFNFKRSGIDLFNILINNKGNVITQLPINVIISSFAVVIIWYLILLIPNLALRVRRFRDAGIANGWMVVILICDYIPWAILIIGWPVSIVARIATLVIELMPSVRYISTNSSH